MPFGADRWRGPPGRARRPVTPAGVLAAVIGAIGLAIMITGYRVEALFGLGFIPARTMGAELPAEISALPVWLTPLGSTIAYIGPIELLFTCAIIVVVGNKVQEAVGTAAMLLLFVLGAYVGAGAYWIEAPASPVPMSGGFVSISALIGAAAMLYRRPDASPQLSARVLNGLALTLVWAVICVGLSFAGGRGEALVPGWSAGIGAFVLGAGLALPLLAWRWRKA